MLSFRTIDQKCFSVQINLLFAPCCPVALNLILKWKQQQGAVKLNLKNK